MCGIVGFFDKTKQYNLNKLSHIITRMTEVIKYRGPDAGGIWVDEKLGLALGHRRLSIVDLSEHGAQPMISRSGRFVLIYNGEIYNAQEIKQELLAPGYAFSGHSDTEVLLAACEEFGIELAIAKTIGMFAFAIWDTQNQLLHLGRDRLGVKPLYWGINNSVLFFGSQVSSFISHPRWRTIVDPAAQAAYFQYNYVPTPLSIFKGIHKLKPGCFVTIDKEFNVKETCYWDLQKIVNNSVNKQQKHTDKEVIEKLDELLKDAVKRRMIADVPVGAFLSGGIDSSTVVALMQAQHTQPVKTFSIGFAESNYNEAPQAKAVANYLHTEHHELYLDSKQSQGIIPNLPIWYDEPFADSSQIPTLLVSKLAKQYVTVSLSGDGGDELFAGYNRYLWANKLWSICKILPSTFRKFGADKITNISPNILDKIAANLPILCKQRCVGDKAHKLAKILNSNNREQIYHDLVSCWQIDNVLTEKLENCFGKNILPQGNNLSFLDWMQYVDTVTYLPDDILTKLDRASMAVSLEGREPLLDHRLVEFAWSLPKEFKIRNGQSKWILRQVLYKYVPAKIIDRPKMGFGIPLDTWLRGSLKDWAAELLTKQNLEANGLKPELIMQYWHEHQSGSKNWQYHLWNILMYQQWCSRWL